jgi:ABC-type multidrug transport system ATPase subunit
MKTISVRNYRKEFRNGRETVSVSCPDWSAGGNAPIWLQGRNGSGKTTLLRSIAGWINQFEGSVEIDGRSVDTLWPPARAVALFPSTDIVPAGRSFRSAIRSIALCDGTNRAAFEAAVLREREMLGIGELPLHQQDGWSTGERKLLGLSIFLALDRGVLLLDEPFASLDDVHRRLLGERITAKIAGGALLIYTDHLEQSPLTDSVRIQFS